VAIARTPDDAAAEDNTAGVGGGARDVQLPERVDDYGAWGDAHEVPRMSTPLTRVVAALVFPFAILISLSHVLYGSGGPGDGFTAGVVSGLAVALWYVVFGYFEARARLGWLSPGRLISFGLLLAITNAFAGAVFGDGFLAIYFEFEGPADLHIASTLLFELSIYLAVFGGVTTIMDAIAHPEDAEKDYE
jgi:multisubunit Na+/H+ antiporter MnhB subunit